MLAHLVLGRRVRHHHAGLGRHRLVRLLRVLGMLRVRGRGRLRRHVRVLRLLAIVHGLLM